MHDAHPDAHEPHPARGRRGRRTARRASAALAALVALAGAAVLVGWWRDVPALKSLHPDYITMKVNTAVSFIALAGALLAALREPVARWRGAVAAVLVVAVAAISALTLIEYLSGLDLGLDELLHADPGGAGGAFPPGRLAPITAVTFLLLAAGITLTHLRRPPAFGAGHVAVLFAFVIGFQGFVGYLLGTTHGYGAAFYTQMAAHTTVLFVLLCLSAFLARPDRGLMEVVASRSAGGRLARSLVATAAVVPPLVAWAARLGELRGLYDADFTTLLRVVGNSAFFAAIVWRNAAALHRLDVARDASEAARARNLEQARRAVRARDEFLTTASHELKTPLTPLRIELDRLLLAARRGTAAAPTPERVAQGAEQALRHLGRLASVIDHLLDLAQVGSGEIPLRREAVSVAAVIAEAAGRHAAELAAADCSLEVEPVDAALRADADRGRLAGMVGELLSNAARHARGARVRVRAFAPGQGEVAIEVADGGPGIAEADRERVFDAFERAGADVEKASGLGLGLHVARQLARAHGGELELAPAPPGAGARFVLRLPAAAPQRVTG